MVNRIRFSPNSANLICRSTDIYRSISEFLGIRDNESRLYLFSQGGGGGVGGVCSKVKTAMWIKAKTPF